MAVVAQVMVVPPPAAVVRMMSFLGVFRSPCLQGRGVNRLVHGLNPNNEGGHSVGPRLGMPQRSDAPLARAARFADRLPIRTRAPRGPARDQAIRAVVIRAFRSGNRAAHSSSVQHASHRLNQTIFGITSPLADASRNAASSWSCIFCLISESATVRFMDSPAPIGTCC